MKALHIFPLFGAELTNGSEYYEYMLTKSLVQFGVSVDVFTTRARQFRPTSAFSLEWGNDYAQDYEQVDGINIHRFPVSFSVPPKLGHTIARFVFKRWRQEEERYGTVLKGSLHEVEHYYRRAQSRPAVYDWLTLLGRGPYSGRLLAAVRRSIHQYDVCLVGFLPFALIQQVFRIARTKKKPLIILPLFHPEDVYHHFKGFYRCFRFADGILAQTPYSFELFQRLFPGARPLQIGAGVDAAALMDPAISGERFRQKYGIGDKKIILFVGRKELHKRYDLAVAAVDRIADEQVKLVMIGADVDGKPITSSHVLYLGKVPREDLLDAYDACDVFVLPSEHESFGIVFLEAWMRKKPVVGNVSCRPVASVIADGIDGFLSQDAQAIAEKIKLLLGSPQLALQLGESGYRKTLTHYTWDAIGKKVYALYWQVTHAS
jgi:glycosyltransferase involved in cell wall biosynthesis